MSYIPTGSTEPQPMPDRYQEYRVRTSLYLMGVLAVKYLRMSFAGSDESLLMPATVYDQWNASHVMSQIEGWKSDADMRDKAFNVLADYREFRNALYREIETLLGHHNDVVWRFMDVFVAKINESIASAANAAAADTGVDEVQSMTEEEREAKRQEVINAVTEAMDKLKAMKENVESAKANLQELNGGEEQRE